jgi:hypothetical protein
LGYLCSTRDLFTSGGVHVAENPSIAASLIGFLIGASVNTASSREVPLNSRKTSPSLPFV